MRDVCQDLGIAENSPFRWAAEDEAFGKLYARAREDQAHALAERAMAIASADDELTQARGEAIENEASRLIAAGDQKWRQKIAALESNLIQRDKLRVDTIKWLASKIAPRLYGERQTMEHTGDGGGPLTVEVVYSHE